MSTKARAQATTTPTPGASSAPVVAGLLRQASLQDGALELTEELVDPRSRRLVSQPPLLQPKLTVNPPDDRYEQEADRIAEQVMRMPEPRLQRQVESEEEEEEEATLQTKPLAAEITPLVQRQAEPEEEEEEEPVQARLAEGAHLQRQAGPEEDEEEEEPVQTRLVEGTRSQRQAGPEEDEEEEKPLQARLAEGTHLQRQAGPEEEEEEEELIQTRPVRGQPRRVGPNTRAQIGSLRSGGWPLPPSVRGFFESRFGHDFGQVRVHTGSHAAVAARAVNARAFTLGRNIVFGAGQYAPQTTAGRELLAHELTHVVQQRGPGAARPAIQRKRTFTGFLRNLGQVLANIFTATLAGDIEYSREALKGYRDRLKVSIEGDYDSDIKARHVVRLWKAGDRDFKLDDPNLKIMLIKEMLAGWTSTADEEAILDLLEGSSARHLEAIFGVGGVSAAQLKSDFHLGMWKKLQAFFARRFWGKLDAVIKGTVIVRLNAKETREALDERMAQTPPDKPGFLSVLEKCRGDHAENTQVYEAVKAAFNASKLTQTEAWQAVVLQNHGPEADWPLVMRNFMAGIRGGTFTPPSGMPPSTRDGLRETALTVAHQKVMQPLAPTPPALMVYRGLFNALWDSAPYRTKSEEFDPNLDSKGPRTPRSRAIFTKLYGTNAAIKRAYDANTGGVREQIDQYIGPEALNVIASPRLQEVIAKLQALTTPITATSLSDSAYVNFKTSIAQLARKLDGDDRKAIRNSHEWRTLIENVVHDSALRSDLTQFIDTAHMTVPPPPPPSPPTSAPTTPPTPAPATPTTPAPTSAPATQPAAPASAGPLTLRGNQPQFVSTLRLTAPVANIASGKEQETVKFQPGSDRDPDGLVVQSQVEVTPIGQVVEGQVTQRPWPVTSARGQMHMATVEVDGGASGQTVFTGQLSLVSPMGAISHTRPRATVTVKDERQAWFKANIDGRHCMLYTDQNVERWYPPLTGERIEFYGGQQALSFTPYLKSANRGLRVFVRARLWRNSGLVYTSAVTEFGRAARSRKLGGYVVLQSTTAPTTVDSMKVQIDFFSSDNTAAGAFSTIRKSFLIHPPRHAYTMTDLYRQAAKDRRELHRRSTGSILYRMNKAGGLKARVAEAIRSPVLDLEPCLVRPDSATHVRGAGRSPGTNVAYEVGVQGRSYTLIGSPGADAWCCWGKAIIVNLTPSLAHPDRQRHKTNMDGLIGTIVHEAVHALDKRPRAGTYIERYKTEFRAYWLDGSFDKYSTKYIPNPKWGNLGPKTARANAIFRHLYGSPTYPWMKREYDANRTFREQVNAFMVPDGINLLVSVRLENLRAAIEGFSGSGFGAHLTAIRTLYGQTDSLDKREVKGNRYWRALVERKYSGTEVTTIKTILGIPQ